MTRLSLGALLLLGTACPSDDVPSVTTEDSSSSGDPTSMGPTTLPDPDTTVGMDTTDGMTTQGETTLGETTEGETEETTEGGGCGNDMIDDGETCDGSDLGDADCVSEGFMGGGMLGCEADCMGYDTSNCNDEMSDCCMGNGTPGCDDMACQDAVCGLDPFCCSMEWDQICAGIAGGEAACAPLNCPPPPSDCCGPNGSPGCSDAACEGAVCGIDPFCCSMEWDQICADIAGGEAACAPLNCPVCGNDVVDGMDSCDGADLGGQDCASLGFAGGTLGCLDDCTFDVSQCMPGMDYTCAEAVGMTPSFMGTNVGEDDDLAESCGMGGGVETVVEFTAAVDGLHTFDAIGSDYDTVLAAFFDCAGVQITCNDDFGGNPDCGMGTPCSQIAVDMTMGQTLLISVAGFGGATGNWVVNVTEPGCGNDFIEGMEVCDGADLAGETCMSQGAGVGTLGCAMDCSAFDTTGCVIPAGDCCAANGSPGCDDPGCTAAICGADPFCCSAEWDQTCADSAVAEPMCMGVGGTCP